MTTTELDYQNRPVPEGETADTPIWVWCVDIQNGERYCVRGWQEMLDLLRTEAEYGLEGVLGSGEPTGEEFSVTVYPKRMLKGDYEDLQEP